MGLPVVSWQDSWVSQLAVFPTLEYPLSNIIFPLCHSYCKSEMHHSNNFEIYRMPPECCNTHFPSSSTCLQEGKDSHAPIMFPAHPRQRPYLPGDAASDSGTKASHRVRWLPDLINKLNCVRGRNFKDLMTMEGYEVYYLFADSTLCCKNGKIAHNSIFLILLVLSLIVIIYIPFTFHCKKWRYPECGSSFSDTQSAVNPEAEDEAWFVNPYPLANYYFPDFAQNSCVSVMAFV